MVAASFIPSADEAREFQPVVRSSGALVGFQVFPAFVEVKMPPSICPG
jgi:hypothetical protein